MHRRDGTGGHRAEPVDLGHLVLLSGRLGGLLVMRRGPALRAAGRAGCVAAPARPARPPHSALPEGQQPTAICLPIVDVATVISRYQPAGSRTLITSPLTPTAPFTIVFAGELVGPMAIVTVPPPVPIVK